MKPNMLFKLDISSVSVQALYMTSHWEMSFYDHRVQRCLALQGNCYNKEVPWHWTSRSQFPSKCSHQVFFFSSSHSSHSLLTLSFFSLQNDDLRSFSHQMKNTCRELSVLLFPSAWLFKGKGEIEDNSLLCATACNSFIIRFEWRINTHQ